jgi:5-methyltetrahydropteroyltriglutamate--homocysteine methyltransferase
MNADVQLDAGEAGCSELTLLIFQTMKSMAPGQILEVLAYDLVAEIDILAWCRMTGNLLVSQNRETCPKHFFIQKGEGQETYLKT